LRRFTERRGEVTFAGVLARWWGTEHAVLRRIIAILTLVFLGTYAAAQLNAGGKALQALFGWDPRSGALIVAAIVAAYCLAGGMRASIWTDVAQSVVMFVAMGAMLAIGLATVGGVGSAVAGLSRVPGYLDPFPPDLLLPGAAGMLLFVVGWMFAGMSVIGQPHIMVRFMALNDPNSLARARVYYYGFFTLFYGMAACVGLLSRLLLPELETLDPELALPMMAVELLPPVFVGVVIAGIFAATMSTADSLVLSCSSALTHDLLPQRIERAGRVARAGDCRLWDSERVQSRDLRLVRSCKRFRAVAVHLCARTPGDSGAGRRNDPRRPVHRARMARARLAGHGLRRHARNARGRARVRAFAAVAGTSLA
jgi:SSS family solute:Na+ symporter/sodium/proline symporter